MNNKQSILNGRTCALVVGLTFTVLGTAAFVPDLVSLPANAVSASTPLSADDIPLTASTDYVGGFVRGFGYLFGLFPTNTLRNILSVVLGTIGLLSATGDRGSYNYNRFCAIFLPLVALLGLLPISNNVMGIMPLFGNDVWLSAIAAVVAIYGTVTGTKPEGEIPT